MHKLLLLQTIVSIDFVTQDCSAHVHVYHVSSFVCVIQQQGFNQLASCLWLTPPVYL